MRLPARSNAERLLLASVEGSKHTVRPQIQLRIEVNVSQRDREKCRMLWVAVPGHHGFNNLQTFQKPVSFRFIPKTLVC
jgi:hypothetical protein